MRLALESPDGSRAKLQSYIRFVFQKPRSRLTCRSANEHYCGYERDHAVVIELSRGRVRAHYSIGYADFAFLH